MIRLFVALIIPGNIVKQIITECDHNLTNSKFYRWENENKIHLTLKFIGEINPEILELIINELYFLEKYNAVSCEATHTGFFYRDQKPSILWAGIKVSEHLYEIVNELNNRLKQFNIPNEKRKFTPHLTLMRVRKKESKELLSKFRNLKFDKIIFKADSIALIKSDLHRSGASYSEIHKYKLG